MKDERTFVRTAKVTGVAIKVVNPLSEAGWDINYGLQLQHGTFSNFAYQRDLEIFSNPLLPLRRFAEIRPELTLLRY
jgi:hypothetical protein